MPSSERTSTSTWSLRARAAIADWCGVAEALNVLAIVVNANGDAEHAAMLLGAAEGLLRERGAGAMAGDAQRVAELRRLLDVELGPVDVVRLISSGRRVGRGRHGILPLALR